MQVLDNYLMGNPLISLKEKCIVSWKINPMGKKSQLLQKKVCLPPEGKHSP